ncbi:MAG TPA: hypothetical protein VK629_11145 [Steroidobacteraceae bacterium]|nr:hypothetical protein [Steroidobacteraceae bacterium]
MSDQKQDEFEQRAKVVLQASADELDARTRSRLTQARHAALDAARNPSSAIKPYMWIPAGAAAAAVAVFLIGRPAPVTESQQVAAAPVDEFEIIAAEDSLEFYRDVDFYAWLAAADADADEEPAPDGEV